MLQVVGKLVINRETKMVLVKQLAFKKCHMLYGTGQSQSPYQSTSWFQWEDSEKQQTISTIYLVPSVC
jgi:hypothetical protein